MESFYSIISFVNSPISNENIAVGLIGISGNEVFYNISKSKIDFARKLNPESGRLLDFAIKQFSNYIKTDIADKSSLQINADNKIDIQYLNRLSIYNNGILQFSKPSFLRVKFDKNSFKLFYNKAIEKPNSDVVSPKLKSTLQQNIVEKIYEPLAEKIDVDFTLNRKSLPSQFFDFHFDALGVNGAVYAAKSIDLNSETDLDDIRESIYKYESILERINLFAKSKNISTPPEYFLIADEYRGKKPSYNELSSLLSESNWPYFKLISSNEVDEFVVKVKKNNASKFSAMLLQ